MQHTILDYIRRHPLTLGYVFLMSLIYGCGAHITDAFNWGFMIVQVAVFGLYGLMLDLPKGYLRVMGMLPLSRQQSVKILWFLGMCLGPCTASLGYWVGALLVVLVGFFWGELWFPDGRMFLVLVEIIVCTGVVAWSSLAASGDPTRKNWMKGVLGLTMVFVWIWPMFIPKEWWQVILDYSPLTVLPVLLAAGGFAYLVTPLIFTSGPSLSWSGGPSRPQKKVAGPIAFPSRRMVLLRALANPFLKASLAMGAGMIGWYAFMMLYMPANFSQQSLQSLSVMMMTMMVFFMFGIGVGSASILRGLRVLPVSTHTMAWGMTLLPLEAWAGFGFIFTLLSAVSGEWPALLGMLPLMMLFAGGSCLVLALVFRSEKVSLFYLSGILIALVFFTLIYNGYLNLHSWAVCLPVGVVCIGLAYTLNLNSLRSRSSLYRPHLMFGQIAQQAALWQQGWKGN